MPDPLWKLSAAAQARAVRRADVSAVELVDSHLERIAEVNPQVNAVTQLLAERARTAAARTDRLRAEGAPLGPLAGVPFTVKETTPSRARRPPSAPRASAIWWPRPMRRRWLGCARRGPSRSGTPTYPP